MSRSNWNYGPLLVGITGATAVIFAEPIARFLERTFEALGISGLVIIPAMALIVLALILHQRVTQAEMAKKARLSNEAIAGDARRAEERARELEHLVRLGEALGARSTHRPSIKRSPRNSGPATSTSRHHDRQSRSSTTAPMPVHPHKRTHAHSEVRHRLVAAPTPGQRDAFFSLTPPKRVDARLQPPECADRRTAC